MALTIGRIKQTYLPDGIANNVADLHEFDGKDVYGIRSFNCNMRGIPVCKSRDMRWRNSNPYGGPSVDDYENVAPFNVRRCITTADNSKPYGRKVLAYEGDANYKELIKSKTGDRMIEFPKGYLYRPDKYTFLVSPTKIDERWSVSPAHDLGVGGEVDYVRRTEFVLPGNGDFQCKVTNTTPNTFSSGFPEIDNLKAKFWHPQSYGFYSWVCILAAIKYNSFNISAINSMNSIYSTAGNGIPIEEDYVQGLDYIPYSFQSMKGWHSRTLGIHDFLHSYNYLIGNVIIDVDTSRTLYYNKDVTNVNLHDLTLDNFKQMSGTRSLIWTLDTDDFRWLNIGLNENDPGLLFNDTDVSDFDYWHYLPDESMMNVFCLLGSKYLAQTSSWNTPMHLLDLSSLTDGPGTYIAAIEFE